MSTKEQREKLGRVRKALASMTDEVVEYLDTYPSRLDNLGSIGIDARFGDKELGLSFRPIDP